MRTFKIVLAIAGGVVVLLIILTFISDGKFKFGTTSEGKPPPGDKRETMTAPTAISSTSDEEVVQSVLFQGTLADMGLRFVQATTFSDSLFANVAAMSKEERLATLDSAIQKWNEAKEAVGRFEEVVSALPDYELSVRLPAKPGFSLIKAANAATVEETIKKLEEEEKRIEAEIKVSQKERELGRKKILDIVDKAPSGEKMKVAAELFGTDAKFAHEALTKMWNLESKIALSQEKVLETYSKTAETIKTGAKVGVFIVGLAPAAGGSAVALAGKAGVELAAAGANLVFTGVTGAGLVMEVSKTAVNIGVAGQDGVVAKIAKAEDAQFFKEMSFVVGVLDPVKAIGQLQKAVNAAGSLKNLLTSEGLAKIAANKQLMADMKGDVSGNLTTIVDAGPKALEFLTDNPGVKTLFFNPAKPSAPITPSAEKTETTQNVEAAKILSDFLQKVYSEAQKISEQQGAAAPESGEPAQTEKPSYNGAYYGSTDAASGVANASLTVEGESVSGRATYRESAGGQTFKIGLSIYGSVREEGRVSGRFSGSEAFGGKTVTVSGSFSGGIYGNTMRLKFRASSSATGETSGSITLSK